MGQDYASPPSVSGWTAYYQAPAFSKLWINSTYIKKRFDFIGAMLFNGLGTNNFSLNILGFLDGLSTPDNASVVIDDICTIFFPKEINTADKIYLKGILTNGLPDFEWTDQYNAYISDPTNIVVSDPVKIRMRFVLNTVFKMPQYETL
jgi:hypothetical protein